MARNEGNIILKSLGKVEKEMKGEEIPPGYIEIKLSTKGKLYAPEVFHIRNFKVGELLVISQINHEDIPFKLTKVLNDMIWEDVDTRLWHEKEVEELMIYLFIAFYKPVLEDVDFPISQEDLDFIKETQGEDTVQEILNGNYSPKCRIDIARDVDTYTLKSDFKPIITITNKKSGFSVGFRYIQYGDQLIINKWMKDYYRNRDEKYKTIEEQIKKNSIIERKMKLDPSFIGELIPIDNELEQEYNDFIIEKLQMLSEICRIVSIVNYDGKDVSNLSLTEKYELMGNDARIDNGMIKRLEKCQAKQMFGVKPEVNIVSPFTKEVVKRPFSFRIPSLLQAVQLLESDEYDDDYGDEE